MLRPSRQHTSWLQPWSFSPSKGHSDSCFTNHECPDLELASAQHPQAKMILLCSRFPTHKGITKSNELSIHPHGCIVSKLHSLADPFQLIYLPWVSCFWSNEAKKFMWVIRCWDGYSCRMCRVPRRLPNLHLPMAAATHHGIHLFCFALLPNEANSSKQPIHSQAKGTHMPIKKKEHICVLLQFQAPATNSPRHLLWLSQMRANRTECHHYSSL